MSRGVAVTGLGIVAPTGIGVEAFWNATLAGRTATGPVSRFDTRDVEGAHAGEIDGFDPTGFMPGRLARKLDPFCHYAIAACRLALDDAGLDLDRVDREATGVYVGNCFGGWEFTDRELRHLHTLGPGEVSPYQATAWFPAAPQGQVSILLGLRGHSKTVVCDRASGLVSIALAARMVAAGDCDVVLAGGCEAPVTPFSYLACVSEGVVDIGDRNGRRAGYRPFDSARSGLIPGEGAAFLVLEAADHAARRDAPVYAQITGAGMANDACHPRPLPQAEGALSDAMRQALRAGGLTPADVGLVIADAMADPVGDDQEAQAVHKVLRSDVAVAGPKAATGHLYGGAGALDAAWAALALEHDVVPPTPGLANPACDLDISAKARTRHLRAAIVNGRGTGGVACSVALARET